MRTRLLVACLAGTLLLPAAAHAQALAWTACPHVAGFQCGTVPVPLDRTGATPGTVTLSATRQLAGPAQSATAVLALAGGPGQAAVPIAGEIKDALGTATGPDDFLTFDQRGTGASNPLDCGALQHPAGSVSSVIEKCAKQIGAARAFFTTQDSVEDIEALRVASGYSKLILYGVSYGTKVAIEYALKYPQNVAGLVLDSVVEPEGPDPFRRPSYQAIPRVLSELCEASACAGISTNPDSDLAKVAAKLAHHDFAAAVYGDTGRRYTATLSEPGLADLIIAGDLNPTLRAELPGSLRAALSGDLKPLLRLSAHTEGLANRFQGESEADSNALFFDTTCEETNFPWTRAASIDQRAKEIEAAAKALPAGALGPFTNSVALHGTPSFCLGWPVAAAPPPAFPVQLAPVPTLILEGMADVRTPLEGGQDIANRTGPNAQVVAVPHVGHSVLGSETTPCAQQAIAQFIAAQPVAQCTDTTNPYSPTPKPPTSLSKVHAPQGLSGKVGRTLEATRETIVDAVRQVIGAELATGEDPAGIGGLRGGFIRVGSKGITFDRMTYVPGVTVSGSRPLKGTAHYTIGGSSAARGSLAITASGNITGHLGGHHIAGHLVRAARHAGGLPSQARALAIGRLTRALG